VRLRFHVGDRDDIAATVKPPQRTNRRAFLIGRESSADTRPHDRARRFRKRQRGRDLPDSST